MALADWTPFESNQFIPGSYGIVTDGASPGTNTAVMQCTTAQGFQNITVGNLLDARIVAFAKAPENSNYQFILRQQDALYVANSNCYLANVQLTSGLYNMQITKNTTTMISATGVSPLTGVTTDWQKWQFSCFSTGGTTYLRLALWNGSAFVTMLDAADSSGSQLATGKCSFSSNSGSATRFDDVTIISLT